MWDVSESFEEAAVLEPVDPLQGGDLDPMTNEAAKALKSRQKTRERRHVQARERRLKLLDPERVEEDRRSDEASLDLEDAQDGLAKAEEGKAAAGRKLALAEVAELSGLEQPVLRPAELPEADRQRPVLVEQGRPRRSRGLFSVYRIWLRSVSRDGFESVLPRLG